MGETEIMVWFVKEGLVRLPSGESVVVVPGDELLVEKIPSGLRALRHYPKLRH